jgi:UDP-N-acetylmuramoyl-L-alanyl-D-glutamate--2,6-diaminopimelate ligase
LENRAELSAEGIRLDAGGSSCRVCFQGRRYPARIPLPGRYNVANVLAAVGAALALGIEPERSLPALEGCPPIPGRMEPVGTGGAIRVLVDFAHTPDALENALKALREIAPARLILVFGCGGDRDRLKRPLMGEIASRLADFTVITSDNPRSEDPGEIIAEIARGIPASRGNYSVCPEREAAIREAVSLAAGGDIVLIAGKGHEEKQIFADREVPFSDRRAAEAALAEKGEGV